MTPELSLFISAKKLEGCSDKTLAYYKLILGGLLSSLDKAVKDIETNDLRTYLGGYSERRGAGNVTLDNMRRVFTSFFKWLCEEEKIGKNPTLRLHRIKTDKIIKEVLSDEDIERIRESCRNLSDLAIVELLASSGIRVGELVKLNRENVNFNERECVVFGKGNKERVAYFDSKTKLHLSAYLASRTDENPALFISLSKPFERLKNGGVETMIRELGKSLGLKKLHPHKFRRTLATRAIDKGMPIEQVQRLLGHVMIGTTMLYAMVNQSNVKSAHSRFIGS
jgi:site-specific recombinase XerD